MMQHDEGSTLDTWKTMAIEKARVAALATIDEVRDELGCSEAMFI